MSRTVSMIQAATVRGACVSILAISPLIFPDNAAAQVPTPPVWSLTRNQRIDAERENLTVMHEAAIGPARELLVPQPSDETLYLYDESGKRIATIGRRGEGPGEIQSLTSFGWKGDSIWAADARQPYLTLFTKAGRYVRQIPYPKTDARSAILNPRAEALYPGAGGALITVRGGTIPPATDCPCVLWMDGTGAQRALIGINPPDIDDSIRNSVGSWAIPFGWQTQRDAAPDGMRVGWLFATANDRNRGQYRVVVIGQRGDTAFNRAFAFEKVPIPASEVERVLSGNARGLANYPVAELRARLPQLYMPYVGGQGIYQGIRMGLDGTVWIGLRATSAGNPWLILDATGNPIGRIVLPANVRLVEANSSTVWALEEDAVGLQSPVRYAVQRGG